MLCNLKYAEDTKKGRSYYLDGCASHQVIGKGDLSLQRDVSIQSFESMSQSI